MALASDWQCSKIDPGPDSHIITGAPTSALVVCITANAREMRHFIVIPVKPCLCSVMVTVVKINASIGGR